MNSKTIGLGVLVIGFLLTIYTGFNYITEEKIIDIGSVKITKDKEHSVNWSPYIGIGMIALGGVLFLTGKKK